MTTTIVAGTMSTGIPTMHVRGIIVDLRSIHFITTALTVFLMIDYAPLAITRVMPEVVPTLKPELRHPACFRVSMCC